MFVRELPDDKNDPVVCIPAERMPGEFAAPI